MPFVSIVMVNWNGREHLARCLASLAPEIESADTEVVLVDNGSEDGSVDMVRATFPWVRVVSTGENLGFAEGCNRGIEASDSEWVFTLNNDCVVEPGTLGRLVAAAHRAPPEVGMLQPCVVFEERPERTNSTGVLLRRNGTAVDRDFDRDRSGASPPGEVFCATAAAALYRRAMLEAARTEAGYFDRRFFMYMEDVDLGWRCRLAGWEARYLSEPVVRHVFQGSSHGRGPRFVEVHCRKNRLRMLAKNASGTFILRTLPRTLGDAARLLLWVGPGIVPRAARALWQAPRARREVDRLRRVERRAVERRWVR